jgi:hypothetical protein
VHPRSQINAHDIRVIALTLVDRHGSQALGYADQAVCELETKGEASSANAWRVLRWEIEDALEGRFERDRAIVLH